VTAKHNKYQRINILCETMATFSSLPPLLPKVDAILILDSEGNRLAGKYYGNFLTNTDPNISSSTPSEEFKSAITVEDLRSSFERQLQSKISGIAARPDAAEVVTVNGKNAVFCGGTAGDAAAGGSSGGDVRVVHVGPSSESELLLAYLCEGMYDALSQLMGGQTDRNMVLDNLELVFLLIDEHCDGGIILEVDGGKLSGNVLLRDEEQGQAETEPAENGAQNMPAGGGMGMGMRGGGSADISVMQAFRAAREQVLSGFTNNEGM